MIEQQHQENTYASSVVGARAAFIALSLTVRAQQAVAVDPNRWETTIQKFEAEDASH